MCGFVSCVQETTHIREMKQLNFQLNIKIKLELITKNDSLIGKSIPNLIASKSIFKLWSHIYIMAFLSFLNSFCCPNCCQINNFLSYIISVTCGQLVVLSIMLNLLIYVKEYQKINCTQEKQIKTFKSLHTSCVLLSLISFLPFNSVLNQDFAFLPWNYECYLM